MRISLFKFVKVNSMFFKHGRPNKRRQADQISVRSSLQFACCAGRYARK